MKKLVLLLLGIISLAVCMNGWALDLEFKVTGIKGKPYENVINTLKNQQGLLTYPLTEDEISRFYAQMPKAIKKSLQPFGYFHAQIDENLIQTPKIWTTQFHITPGPQMPVTELTLEIHGMGKDQPAFIDYLHKTPLKIGLMLNIDDYEQTKDDLFKLASEYGYFKAQMVQSHIIVDLKNYQAKIIIVFDTGPRYLFGDTEINPTKFNDKFLRGFLAYHADEFYDANKLFESQQNYAKSNFFSQAVITPHPDQAINNRVPIQIELVPTKARQYSYGLGYGTDTGIRGTVGVNLRHLNQYGHHLNFLAQIATPVFQKQSKSAFGNSNVTLNYTIPGRNPVTDQYIFSAGYGSLQFYSNRFGTTQQVLNQSQAQKLSGTYATYLGPIQQNISLTYLNENYYVPSLNIPFAINSDVLYPSINWQFLKRDNDLEPTHGINLNALISYAPFAMKKDSNFLQFRLQAHFLYTFFNNLRVLLRGEYGYTDIESLSNLPLSLQLFAGGATSIRGFGYNQLGPGRNLIVGSVELQQRIYKNLFIGGFIDAGNVTPLTDFMPNIFANAAAGPAIAYVTPVGTLEATLARSLNPRDKNIWRFQFSMGQDL